MNNCFVKVLGCGSSVGCPMTGCSCSVCASSNPKNNRTRTSLYINHENKNILIDAGPDLRHQMLREKISHIDHVLYTHKHADHTTGTDDLRTSFVYKKSTIDVYGNYDTLNHCYDCFKYMFKGIDFHNQSIDPYIADDESDDKSDMFRVKPLKGHIIQDYDEISIENLKIKNFLQHHGKIDSIGYLLEDYNFAYSTDVFKLPERSLKLLSDAKLKTWIVSLTFKEGNNAHASFERIQEYNRIIKPEKTILTHMSHRIDYEDNSFLDENMEFGYDGMRIELD